MKRFIPALILVSAALTLFAGVAQARWSEPQDIAWQRQRVWNTGGYSLIARQDTMWTTGGDAKVDTSVAFTLLDADLPQANQFGTTSTTQDTLIFGYLTIYGDSSATNTVNFKAGSTCAIQINWGTSSVSWATAKTYTCGIADGVKFWTIPLFVDALEAANTSADYAARGSTAGIGSQKGWQFAPAVRLIFTGTTSTSVPAMRIRLTKYRAPGSTAGGATTNW